MIIQVLLSFSWFHHRSTRPIVTHSCSFLAFVINCSKYCSSQWRHFIWLEPHTFWGTGICVWIYMKTKPIKFGVVFYACVCYVIDSLQTLCDNGFDISCTSQLLCTTLCRSNSFVPLFVMSMDRAPFPKYQAYAIWTLQLNLGVLRMHPLHRQEELSWCKLCRQLSFKV